MNDRIWMLANLTDEQLNKVQEAERTLGAEYILVFQPASMQVAELDESQVECLQGLEQDLGMTTVAYKHS